MESNLRILHLEDEPIDSELVRELLTADGLRVVIDRVDTFAEFKAALESPSHALVLSDYAMPGVDPMEALRLVRQQRPEMPFIFVSGTLGEELAIETLKMGATDYVLKQRMTRLVPAVRRAMQEAEEQTRRKQAEEAVRHSEERYREMFSTMLEGFCIIEILFDADNRPVDYCFLETNPAFETLTDLRNAQGKRMRELTPEIEPHWFEVYGKVALTGQPARFVNESKALHRWYDVSAYRVGGPSSRKVAVLFNDISEAKRAEAELIAAKLSAEAAKAAAEEASKAKDHFLAVLSHELRTPLTPVVTAVSMLQGRPDLDPATRDALEMVRRNVEMEARLIDDLLDVTRITRGKVELARSPVELCTVINRAVEVCRPDIEARGLEFGIDWGQRPYWVEADFARLQQVFWNLLKNAIKFTPHGGCVGMRCRRESVAIDHQHRTTDHVVIEVNDSGIGIEADALPRLFDAFEQAERSITRQFGGLGLGLTISKALVEMHGGMITAHSAGKDKGATFRVRLPLVVGGALSGRGGESQPTIHDEQSATPKSLRILLVEDHGDTARIMRQLLMQDGHDVKVAGDVATALDAAGKHPFDLLISDLGLPDRSGLDLMQELRARGRTMPGIALSGYGQEQDIQRSKEAGFAAHLTKPTSPDRLAEAIAAVTGSA